MKKIVATLLSAGLLALPIPAFAYPFGGMINQIIFCFNNAIYTAVGPPRGGPFIWTPSTRTYQFGPPVRTGQWLLGLAAPPYFCLVSVQPIIVWAGILMTMEGSSAPGGFSIPGGRGAGGSGGSSGGGSGANGSTNAGPPLNHIAVSEVYYRADASHGGTVKDEFIEIFNPVFLRADISRWTLRSSTTAIVFPQGTFIPGNGHLVLTSATTARALWNIPTSTPIVPFSSAFSGYLSEGDHLILENQLSQPVDAMSWGSDTSVFSPSAPTVQLGHALIRKNLVTDTDTSKDWIDTPAPNPGR